jgi:hypothetical protein
MKALSLLITVVLVAVPGVGSEHDRDGREVPRIDRSEPEAVVEALYRAVSFERGGEPDWGTLRSLFEDGAVLAQPRRGTRELELVTVDEFIARFRADLASFEARGTGFLETVAGSECRQFGRTALCRVVFEARFDPASADPVGRGVDTLQLVRNGERWWIVAVATEYERADLPLPPEVAAMIEPDEQPPDPLADCSKLGFDASELDERGLLGPQGGKVALSYEFCIPRDQELVDQVRSIDPSVAMHADSSGRVGCGPDQVLCIGSTHQKGFRDVLAALCELDFVTRIERCDFE